MNLGEKDPYLPSYTVPNLNAVTKVRTHYRYAGTLKFLNVEFHGFEWHGTAVGKRTLTI